MDLKGENFMDRENRLKRMESLIRNRKLQEKREEDNQIKKELKKILGDKEIQILSKNQSEEIESKLIINYPFASWGRIDWSKVDKKYELIINENIEKELLKLLTKLNINTTESTYLIFGNPEYPIIQTSIQDVLNQISEIMFIGPDQWLLDIDFNYIIELTHDNILTVGLKDSYLNH